MKKNRFSGGDALLSIINNKTVRYVSLRTAGQNEEKIIGRAGVINIRAQTLSISCEEGVVFRKSLTELDIGELLSREGATFTFEEDGAAQTVIAYYTYYRK